MQLYVTNYLRWHWRVKMISVVLHMRKSRNMWINVKQLLLKVNIEI